MSGNQLKTLIHNTAHNMARGLKGVSKPGITSKGSRYHKAFYAYPLTSDIPSGGAIRTGELLIEINSFANPYPWQMRKIESFITTFLTKNGNEDIINKYGMNSFEVPVLDKKKTLTEKVVSLMRYSLANSSVNLLKSKIRHFYDIYYLLMDSECKQYVNSTQFKEDFETLFADDQRRFDLPEGWQSKQISDSPLILDWHNTWSLLSEKYITELPELAYDTIPSSDEIESKLSELFLLKF